MTQISDRLQDEDQWLGQKVQDVSHSSGELPNHDSDPIADEGQTDANPRQGAADLTRVHICHDCVTLISSRWRVGPAVTTR